MSASQPVASAEQRQTAATSARWLPLAYMLHLLEEWFGGFVPWTAAVLGWPLSEQRFLAINAVALAVCSVGIFAARRSPRIGWFAVTLAAVLGLNGLLHALASLGFARYSPGTVTGVLIYLPLAARVIVDSRPRMSASTLHAALLSGVLIHGLIAWIAFG